MRSLAGFMAIAVFPVFSRAGDGPDEAAKSPASLQPAIAAILKKVTPSVVSIWHGEAPRSNLSGVIVSKDGLIVTAGHIRRKVGEAVEIHLPGKKTVEGKVLAKHKEHDLALVQITEKGAWPAVEVGSSGTLTVRDPLLALGFGHTGLYGPTARNRPATPGSATGVSRPRLSETAICKPPCWPAPVTPVVHCSTWPGRW